MISHWGANIGRRDLQMHYEAQSNLFGELKNSTKIIGSTVVDVPIKVVHFLRA